MDIFGLLTMIGGLALFLYGMHIMGDGLAKTSGGKLEGILEKFTSKVKPGISASGLSALLIVSMPVISIAKPASIVPTSFFFVLLAKSIRLTPTIAIS